MKHTPTKEEWQLIHDSVYLFLVIAVCENQLRKLNESKVSVKKLFQMATQALIRAVRLDLDRVNKELRTRRIRVDKPNASEANYNFRCFIYGTEEPFGLEKEAVRKEIGQRLSTYIANLSNSLSDRV